MRSEACRGGFDSQVDGVRTRMDIGLPRQRDRRGTSRPRAVMEPNHRCTSISGHPGLYTSIVARLQYNRNSQIYATTKRCC